MLIRRLFSFLFVVCSVGPILAHSTPIEVFEQKGKFGLKKNGVVIIPAKYQALGWSDGRKIEVYNNSVAFLENNLWGIISLENKVLRAAQYQDLLPGVNALYIASKKGRLSGQTFYGLISAKGSSIIPFSYVQLSVLNRHLRAVSKKSNQHQYGILSAEGNIIVPFSFAPIAALGQHFYMVGAKENCTIYQDNGNKILENVAFPTPLDNQYFTFKQKHLEGVFNTSGKLLIPARYKSIVRENGKFIGQNFRKWSVLKEDLNVLYTGYFDELYGNYDSLNAVSANGKFWLVDNALQAISERQYNYIHKISNTLFIVKNEQYGLIDGNENEILPLQYDSILFENGFVKVQKRKKSKKWQLYDVYGVKRTEFNYDYIGPFTNRYFKVKRNGFWGFIDRRGNEKIHCVYQEVSEIKDKLIAVKFHDQYSIIDTDNKWLVAPTDRPLQVINTHLYVEHNGKQKLIKDYDQNLVYFTSNPLSIKSDHLIETLPNGMVQQINFDGQRRVPFEKQESFQHILGTSESFTGVRIDQKWGFVDAQQRLRISNRYDSIQLFSEGRAAIKLLGKWGFIDKNENIIIQPNYSSVSSFKNGVSFVQSNNKYGLIGLNGKQIITCVYDDIESFSKDFILIQKNDLFGIANNQGKIIIQPRYEKISMIENNRFIIQKLKKYGVIDASGINILPTAYISVAFLPHYNYYLVSKQPKSIGIK